MKFLRMMLAAALCAAALTGCGGSGTGGSAYTTGDVDKIAQAGAFSEELESVDGDTAFALYGLADAGLDRAQLTDCAVLRSAGATCEEAAVLILDSEDAAQTAMTALDGYLQKQIDTNKDYRPEEIPKLESAWTSARENTVLLVLAEDVNAAMDAVKNSSSRKCPSPGSKTGGCCFFYVFFTKARLTGTWKGYMLDLPIFIL